MDWTDNDKNTRTLMYGEPYKAVVLFKNLEWPYHVAKHVRIVDFIMNILT